MTKEELKAIGLTDEQTEQVFVMNGKDVTAVRDQLSTAEQARDRYKAQVETNGAGVSKLLKSLGLESEGALPGYLDGVNTAKERAQQLDEFKGKYEATNKELQGLKNTATLRKAGAPAEMLDFLTFKVNQMVTDEKDFETATGEYFKAHPVSTAKLSTAAGMEDKTQEPTQNDAMNNLIRGGLGKGE